MTDNGTLITAELFSNFKNSLLEGDRNRCSAVVSGLLQEKIQLKSLYVDLFQRSMYEVGTMWEENQISVAVEHMCTSITEHLIAMAYPLIFSAEHTGKKAVVTCTPGEYHQIGARMVADHFELHGWDAYFLGADTPLHDLIDYLTLKSPDLLAISMSVFFNIQSLAHTVQAVHKHFPKLPVVLGGQGFRWGGDDVFADMEQVHIIHSLDELEKTFLVHG
jgi:methanogenic corrinoid protein MtbC1